MKKWTVKKRKCMAAILSFAMMSAVGVNGIPYVGNVGTISDLSAPESRAEAGYGLSNPRVEMQTRDVIEFGSYWQEEYTPEKEIENPVEGKTYTDTDSKNTEMIYQGGDFFKKSPIKWQILSEEDADGDGVVDDLFLLADQVLDCKKYNENGATKIDSDGNEYTDYSCTWKTSTLRSWLNSEFYSTAFSGSEQSAIKDTAVTNEDNPDFETESGSNTTDKLFLLSLSEIIDQEYGFHSDQFFLDQARQANATEYVKSRQSYLFLTSPTGTSDWWLRSLYPNNGSAAQVLSNGAAIDYNDIVYEINGVRPALHVNAANAAISSSLSKKMSKEVALAKSTWDTVEFGTYNGSKITWRVLSVNGDDAFLLADRILFEEPYNEYGVTYTYSDEDTYTDYSCTWETSHLRFKLNNTFYWEAFTSAEQGAIVKTTLANEDNPFYGTSGGNETTDFVFLLSLSDVVNKSYGFPTSYDCHSASRQAVPTDSKNPNSWWLRSPGSGASNVTSAVSVDSSCSSNHAVDNNTGVRPALHLNLSSSVWTKGKEVTSEDKNTANTNSHPIEDSTTPGGTSDSTASPTKAADNTTTPTKVPDSTVSSAPTATPGITPTPAPAGSSPGTTTPSQTKADSDKADSAATDSDSVKAPAVVKSVKVTNKKAGKTVVSFKKVSGAEGYQIQYAKNKKFTKGKKSKTTKKTTYTIKKLTKKTTYYFRVRAYVKESSGKKVYGKWSAVKKLKIKK